MAYQGNLSYEHFVRQVVYCFVTLYYDWNERMFCSVPVHLRGPATDDKP